MQMNLLAERGKKGSGIGCKKPKLWWEFGGEEDERGVSLTRGWRRVTVPEQRGSKKEAMRLALRNATPTTQPFFSPLIVPHLSPEQNKEGLTHY